MARAKNWVSPQYWQSAAYNQELFDFFFAQLKTLAMARFRWVNLPPKVNTRFLEWCLLEQGMATITWPDGLMPENAFAMQAVTKSGPDANYDYPRWQALGVNGIKWDVRAHVNGVIVWDSALRVPSLGRLKICASEMCSIMRTKQLVRMHMRVPVVMRGPREMKQQMQQMWAQVADGEPCVITFNDFRNVDTSVLPIASGREDMELRELQDDMANQWNIALRYLGIDASPRKMERQTSEEIEQAGEPTSLLAKSALDVRREACRQLNDLTGGDAYCYWNQDVESDTYNMIHDAKAMMEGGDINVSGDGDAGMGDSALMRDDVR